MTDLQLLLSIGIPSLLIGLSILQNNFRFSAIDKRMDGLDKRVDGIDGRFDRMESSVDARFNKIDADLRAFRSEHHQDLAGIHVDLKQFYGMTTKLEGRMDEISKR
jgi:hypothetical protein